MRKSGAKHALGKEGGVNVSISGVLRTGDELGDGKLVEGRLGPHGTEESQSNGDDLAIDGVGESVKLNFGGTGGVGRVEVDGSAREGLLNTNEAVGAVGGDGELSDGGILAAEDVGDDGTLGSDTLEELLVVLVSGGEVIGDLLGVDAVDDGLKVLGHVRERNEGKSVATSVGVGAGLVSLVLGP